MRCEDPRHDKPCVWEEGDECVACMQECSTDYWFEDDGAPWGEVGLKLSEQGKSETDK